VKGDSSVPVTSVNPEVVKVKQLVSPAVSKMEIACRGALESSECCKAIRVVAFFARTQGINP
jgi:hypothetical protein